MTTEHRVKVDGGKYEFIVRVHGRIDIHRDGKPWVWDLDVTSDVVDAILSMMCELDAARFVLSAARVALAIGVKSDGLSAAIALHDRLTSDREPPSAWCGVSAAEPTEASDPPALGLLDLVYDIASDILADREPRWSTTQHRDNCRLIARRVASEIGAMQRQADAEAGLKQNREIIRAWLGIDTVCTIAELDALWAQLEASNIGDADRADAFIRYRTRREQLAAAVFAERMP